MSDKNETKEAYASLKEDFKEVQAGLRHVSELVIFMAAYELGERAGRGENVDKELAEWRESLDRSSKARGF